MPMPLYRVVAAYRTDAQEIQIPPDLVVKTYSVDIVVFILRQLRLFAVVQTS
jgi:hypothetical protein